MSKKLILVADFDGTLFDPDIRILLAPFYNLRLGRLVHRKQAKLVINTGREDWNILAKVSRVLLGIKEPDVVIAGAGTKIYWQDRENKNDKDWEKIISESWSKEDILEKIIPTLEELRLHTIGTKNPYMIRILIDQKKLSELKTYIKYLEDILGESVKILPAERLSMKNTETIFSGYIIIIPKSAGKENAAKYVIEKFAHKFNSTTDCLIFGDGSIDIPMLTLKKTARSRISSFGLHLTPYAKELLKKIPEHSVTLLETSAPHAILESVGSHKASQNSPFRKPLRFFESSLDHLVDSSMSPDDISRLGLEKVKKGTSLIYSKSFFKRLIGFFFCLQGFLLDVFDGIRAKKSPESKTKEGQLIDVYCDRMKEIITLFKRGRTRTGKEVVDTYECAFTCLLPSIARAQAQAINITVPELDRRGGSSLGRSYRLLLSLFYESMLLRGMSLKNDRKIMQNNIDTYLNRKRMISSFSFEKLNGKNSDNSFQREGVERLLFLIQLLQALYQYVFDIRFSEDSLKRQFVKKIAPYVKEYLEVDLEKIRNVTKIKQPSFFDILQDLPQPS